MKKALNIVLLLICVAVLGGLIGIAIMDMNRYKNDGVLKEQNDCLNAKYDSLEYVSGMLKIEISAYNHITDSLKMLIVNSRKKQEADKKAYKEKSIKIQELTPDAALVHFERYITDNRVDSFKVKPDTVRVAIINIYGANSIFSEHEYLKLESPELYTQIGLLERSMKVKGIIIDNQSKQIDNAALMLANRNGSIGNCEAINKSLENDIAKLKRRNKRIAWGSAIVIGVAGGVLFGLVK